MKLIKINKNILYIFVIIIVSIITRTIFLQSIPPNISGDEVTNLNDIYKILFQNKIFVLEFMGDFSEFGINFYLPAIFIKIFGISIAIYIYRLWTSLLSILAIVSFYLLIKERTDKTIGLLSSLLLSTNYVFLNFSRTAWVNMETIFWGLITMLFLELAAKKNRIIFFILGGVCAGMLVYGYNYGRILAAGICFYLFIVAFLKNSISKKGAFLFFIFLLLVSIPALTVIFFDKGESITRRANATFAFKDSGKTNSSTISLIRHQLEYTTRGLVFLDGKVMSEGTENRRYVPLHKPPVDLIIKILFIIGLIYVVYKRKLGIWSVVLVTSYITVFLNELPPNYSRGLFTIPFIYFVISIFVFDLKNLFNRNHEKYRIVYSALTITFVMLLMLYNTGTYFIWMRDNFLAQARQPAIEYQEYEKWQNFQIQRIKNDLVPLNNYEWYLINPRMPN